MISVNGKILNCTDRCNAYSIGKRAEIKRRVFALPGLRGKKCPGRNVVGLVPGTPGMTDSLYWPCFLSRGAFIRSGIDRTKKIMRNKNMMSGGGPKFCLFPCSMLSSFSGSRTSALVGRL